MEQTGRIQIMWRFWLTARVIEFTVSENTTPHVSVLFYIHSPWRYVCLFPSSWETDKCGQHSGSFGKGLLIIRHFVCPCRRPSAVRWAFWPLMYSLRCLDLGCGGESFAWRWLSLPERHWQDDWRGGICWSSPRQAARIYIKTWPQLSAGPRWDLLIVRHACRSVWVYACVNGCVKRYIHRERWPWICVTHSERWCLLFWVIVWQELSVDKIFVTNLEYFFTLTL